MSFLWAYSLVLEGINQSARRCGLVAFGRHSVESRATSEAVGNWTPLVEEGGDMALRQRSKLDTAYDSKNLNAKATILASFRKLDVYPKLEDSLRVKTSTGATCEFELGVRWRVRVFGQ